MSLGISSQGTYIEVGDGSSPQVWSEIPECRTIPGPSGKSDEIDMTHLRSVGGRKEFIQSFKDTDDLALSCAYIPGNVIQAQLRADYGTGLVREYRKTYPNGSTDQFSGYVKACGSPTAVGNAVMFEVTLRVTGFVTFHA